MWLYKQQHQSIFFLSKNFLDNCITLLESREWKKEWARRHKVVVVWFGIKMEAIKTQVNPVGVLSSQFQTVILI